MNVKARQLEIELERQQEAEQAERAKKSPFKRFYQVNQDMTKERLWLIGEYPRAYQILVFMEGQMDDYNALVASYKVFQEALNIGQATVARNIKILKEHKFIDIYKSGTANVYVINRRLSWKSWGTNYKYAKFDAKIILSQSEQETFAKKIVSDKIKVVDVLEEIPKKSSKISKSKKKVIAQPALPEK